MHPSTLFCTSSGVPSNDALRTSAATHLSKGSCELPKASSAATMSMCTGVQSQHPRHTTTGSEFPATTRQPSAPLNLATSCTAVPTGMLSACAGEFVTRQIDATRRHLPASKLWLCPVESAINQRPTPLPRPPILSWNIGLVIIVIIIIIASS